MRITIVGCRFACSTGKRNISVFERYAKMYPHDSIVVLTGDKYLWDKWQQTLPTKIAPNLRLKQIPVWWSEKGQFRYAMPTMLWEIWKTQPDMVYLAEEPIQPFVTWIGAMYCKMLRIPYCIFTYENQYKKWWWPIRMFERISSRWANKVVAASRKAEEILIEKLKVPSGKIVVFPETGVDQEIFKKTVPRGKRKDVVLFTGRFLPEKGIKEMMEAKRMLDNKGKKYKWIFVGSGPLEQFIRDNAGDNSEMIKWLPPEELPKYYNMAKVFLYPSIRMKHWEEQFGYGMIESISCGTPVISTPNTGALEVLPEEWMFVPFSDSLALAKKIEEIMAMKEEFDWGRYIAPRFSLETIAKKWHKVFVMSRD